MKTLLLSLALIALQMGVLGQPTANNTKSISVSKSTSVKSTANASFMFDKVNVKNATEEKKGTKYEVAETAHFFTLKTTPVNAENFVFLVGSSKVPGYEMKVCNVEFKNNNGTSKRFNNGRSAPVLQLFVEAKENYAGGLLEDDKGKQTTITSASLQEEGNTVRFTVVGKEFSKSFTLETGEILAQSNTTLVLYTDKIGIWKVIKKTR